MDYGICQRLHWGLSVKGHLVKTSDAWVKRVEGLARERFILHAPWRQGHIALWLYAYMPIGIVCCTL